MPGHNDWFGINLHKNLSNHDIEFQAELRIAGADLAMPFTESSDYTAKLIASKYKNLYLSLSGGLDSEYVATVLIRNNIPFTPVILITPDNLDEVWFAKYFCHQKSLTPLILDFRDKYNQLLAAVLRHARAISSAAMIGFYTHVIAEHIGDSAHLLTGFGEPFSNSNDYDVAMGNQLEIEEHDFYLDVTFGNQHPGGFLSYTPELFFSLINHIDIDKNTQAAKTILYNISPRIKSTSTLSMPKFVPANATIRKPNNKKCITLDRNALLEKAKTHTIIELKN